MNISPDVFLLQRPFGDAYKAILDGWWEASKHFTQTSYHSWRTEEFAASISNKFEKLGGLPTQNDPHLSAGMFDSLRTISPEDSYPSGKTAGRRPVITRPYALLLRQFTHYQVKSTIDIIPRGEQERHNRPKQYLFSPLFLLRQLLTSPTYLASEGYAHAVVRAEIFRTAIEISQLRRGRTQSPFNAIERIKSLIDFELVAASLQKAHSYEKKGDTFYPADPTDFIVGHLLASRGLAVLTFAPGDAVYQSARTNELPLIGRDTFLKDRTLSLEKTTYEFRILDDVERVPSAAELTNELDGLPIPIPGASTIFARGLRATTSRGVVGRVSGEPGSGKTTFALSLAASLAPLGIITHYVSCEESEADLRKRIFTISPSFVSRTSSFPKKLDDWFIPEHLNQLDAAENRNSALSIVSGLIRTYAAAGIKIPLDCPPGLIPLLVVLDGIHELLDRDEGQSRNASHLARLLLYFRELGAMVLILTAETSENLLRELDYAVDFVMRVGYSPKENLVTPPDRRVVLYKTRLQYSRHGSHVLHISRNEGLKIYPHLAAQLDVFSSYNWKQADKNRWYDFLQVADDTGRPFVRIYYRSQVLITGRGSSGKAAFGLKLLTMPLIDDMEEESRPQFQLGMNHRSELRIPRRILVVSFLYAKPYYDELLKGILPRRRFDSSKSFSEPDILMDAIHFYPGYLSPEVLLGKITTKLNEAILDGFPFDGVLIDGLHNVFLQFPALQDTLMVWPVLLEILRIIGVTVVTTHTHFDVYGMGQGTQIAADVEMATRRVAPLLQALINSADFYIDVSAPPEGHARNIFKIEIVNALGQESGPSPAYWDRTNLLVRPL